ncbi:MAG: SUMF1/EgtB/PvdO family nonheme iron enzyme [Hyphomicrobium aestuarii]|nr:SUMF1/EgtB/PvdO family nonheme iron enzyme [Hyphomicrobium aestuarii]
MRILKRVFRAIALSFAAAVVVGLVVVAQRPIETVAVAQTNAQTSVLAANPALLVVNKEYQHIDKLPTAENDGRRLAEVLRKKPGFAPDLQPQKDLTPDDFEVRWSAFREQILAMKADGVAMFYFSGHGVEIDNDSYLVPIDVPKGASESHLRSKSVSLRRLFREFRGWQEVLASRTSAIRVNGIFIIDACREIPVPQAAQTKSTKGFTPVVATPVAPPSRTTQSGMIVLYAASAGQVAHTVVDGSDPADKPSVYTKHLSQLLESGLAVQTSATRVRWEVHKEVAAYPNLGPQTPAFYDELLETIDVWGKTIPTEAEPPSAAVAIRRPVEPSQPVWECETCPHLVVVPPGSFKMGSPPKELGRHPSEGQAGSGDKIDGRIEVTIPEAFAIGTREVTRKEYQAYIRDRYARSCPSTLPVCAATVESLNRPVTNVSWRDVQDYIAWLNTRIGLGPDKPGKGYYRLPTEAEWEYAARGGIDSRFISGDDPSKLCLYGNGADQSLNTMTLLSVNNTCNDGKGRDLADVQSYKPNGFGLYDVHGNAWEWVGDCWTDMLGAEKAKADASGPGSGETKETCRRVARGGSWRSAPEALRLAKRVPFPPDHARVTLGFRVARVLAKSEVVAAK